MSLYRPAVGNKNRAVKHCSTPWPCASCLPRRGLTRAHRSNAASSNQLPRGAPCLSPHPHLPLYWPWNPWEHVIYFLCCHLLKWSIRATRWAVGVTSWLAPSNNALPRTPAPDLDSAYLFAAICFWISFFPMRNPGIVHTHDAQKPRLCLQ